MTNNIISFPQMPDLLNNLANCLIGCKGMESGAFCDEAKFRLEQAYIEGHLDYNINNGIVNTLNNVPLISKLANCLTSFKNLDNDLFYKEVKLRLEQAYMQGFIDSQKSEEQ